MWIDATVKAVYYSRDTATTKGLPRGAQHCPKTAPSAPFCSAPPMCLATQPQQ